MSSRFPQHIRAGHRPMLPQHEDALSTAIDSGREIHAPIDDKSLGALVIARNQGDPCVLMIAQKSTSGGAPAWCFPKGHPDAGESDTAGAIREVLEETGVDITDALVPDVFTEQAYTFSSRLHNDRWEAHAAFPDEARRPYGVVHKLVRYYLAVLDDVAAVTIQEAECAGAEWLPIPEALSRLSPGEGTDAFRAFFESDAVRARVQQSKKARVASPQHVCIVGTSGSGKSYLAKELAALLNLTPIFLDELYFDTAAPRENGKLVRRPEEEKLKLLVDGMRDAADGGWVIEGVFGELIDVATAATADCTLLWLNVPWEVCKARIDSRPQNLEGAGGADSAETLAKLSEWAKAYWTRDDKRSATGHAAMLKAHAEKGLPVLELCSEDDVAAFLTGVREEKSVAAAARRNERVRSMLHC